MVDAICKEITLKSEDIKNVKTLYFGGGTPSILSPKQLNKILLTLEKIISTALIEEFTLEVNPDDVSLKSMQDWKSLGINRLSIGVQSFNEDHLKWMNRSHNAVQAQESIEIAIEEGFKSSSIDLIYGFEMLSMEQWERNVSTAIESGLSHISAYTLTIEPRTAFEKLSKTQKLLNDERAWEQFLLINKIITLSGWDHYEISNFSKKEFHSKHNSAYWGGSAYIGIGPGAHSFDGVNKRSWNISDNWKYIDLMNSGKLSDEKEFLTPEDRKNEQIMLGLRTSTGVPKQLLKKSLLSSSKEIKSLIENGELYLEKGHWKLNLLGWWKSDHIASLLFNA